MKKKVTSGRYLGSNGTKKSGRNDSVGGDPFFLDESKKRKVDDEIIESSESDKEDEFFESEGLSGGVEGGEGDEILSETADERRLRLAKLTLKKYCDILRDGGESDEEGDDHDLNSRLAEVLEREQLEERGQLRRTIASRVQKPQSGDKFQIILKHAKSVTAVALSENDSKGFSASKDGMICSWNIESSIRETFCWPDDSVLKSHGSRDPQGRNAKHSKNVFALAVSDDGRYLASGGLDRHVHLWDTRTRKHIQSFPGHRGAVSCLTFREGTFELFSGSFDRTVKIWNVEDRVYINTLFGHQSEILTIDCLRKERLLTTGRDRTLQLWKVPEEKRLVFRAPQSHLECSCFISDNEFLSGSDDGSIELWNMLRKKPLHVLRNSHGACVNQEVENIQNGHSENGFCHGSASSSWVGSVAVCRGSDLAASGSGDGFVRLWGVESKGKDIRPVLDLPLVGFVNSLAIARCGKFVVAGVGQEPRLGRWARQPCTQNGVALHHLNMSSDT